MKAIVLTYDRNAILTEHMIRCYEDLWPDHPFVFRVPYQNFERCIPANNREYVKTPPEIKPTVISLLNGLDDNEWILWNIDDRFPTNLLSRDLNYMMNRILPDAAKEFSGLMFCRASIMARNKHLIDSKIEIEGYEMIERLGYSKIWVPQFVRVKVIRCMFSRFPDVIEKAIMMDGMKNNLEKLESHQLFVTKNDFADYEESTIGGILTKKCLDSLLIKGFHLPEWFHGKTVVNPVRRGLATF